VHQQGVVVVGAGIVGLATAYRLLCQDMRHVTVLDQATVDHRRGTSHGLSRLLRFEYGADRFYSEMVQLSLQRWKDLAQRSSRILYTPTALLTLGNEDDTFTQASYHILYELGLPVRSLTRSTCKRLFPQFNTQGYDLCIYNTEAAILYASACLQTLRDLILDLGGTILESKRIITLSHENQRTQLRFRCSDGSEISADRAVLATGPWVHRLLGELDLPVRVSRQYLLYFANLAPSSFGLRAFPAFLSDDLYGFPIHSTCAGNGPGWLKIASHAFGVSVDPDAEPTFDERTITQIAEKAGQLIPALQHARLAHVDACMYDISPDEGFILDYLPGDARIVFATGLTGHGFKFGPLLGELLSSLVRGIRPPVPTERFRLTRFTAQQRTSVA
jgi:monomeric sarcosine oxidase